MVRSCPLVRNNDLHDKQLPLKIFPSVGACGGEEDDWSL
jgi:hypothetical protein